MNLELKYFKNMQKYLALGFGALLITSCISTQNLAQRDLDGIYFDPSERESLNSYKEDLYNPKEKLVHIGGKYFNQDASAPKNFEEEARQEEQSINGLLRLPENSPVQWGEYRGTEISYTNNFYSSMYSDFYPGFYDPYYSGLSYRLGFGSSLGFYNSFGLNYGYSPYNFYGHGFYNPYYRYGYYNPYYGYRYNPYRYYGYNSYYGYGQSAYPYYYEKNRNGRANTNGVNIGTPSGHLKRQANIISSNSSNSRGNSYNYSDNNRRHYSDEQVVIRRRSSINRRPSSSQQNTNNSQYMRRGYENNSRDYESMRGRANTNGSSFHSSPSSTGVNRRSSSMPSSSTQNSSSPTIMRRSSSR